MKFKIINQIIKQVGVCGVINSKIWINPHIHCYHTFAVKCNETWLISAAPPRKNQIYCPTVMISVWLRSFNIPRQHIAKILPIIRWKQYLPNFLHAGVMWCKRIYCIYIKARFSVLYNAYGRSAGKIGDRILPNGNNGRKWMGKQPPANKNNKQRRCDNFQDFFNMLFTSV